LLGRPWFSCGRLEIGEVDLNALGLCGGREKVTADIKRSLSEAFGDGLMTPESLNEFKDLNPDFDVDKISSVLNGGSLQGSEGLVLSLLSLFGIQFEKVLSLDVTGMSPDQVNEWKAQMDAEEAGPGFAAGGLTIDPNIRLSLYIRFKALRELCS